MDEGLTASTSIMGMRCALYRARAIIPAGCCWDANLSAMHFTTASYCNAALKDFS